MVCSSSVTIHLMLLLHVALSVTSVLISKASAWIYVRRTRFPRKCVFQNRVPPPTTTRFTWQPIEQKKQQMTLLQEKSSGDDSSSSESISLRRTRARFAGVSVSSTGFWAILQLGPDDFLSLQVTDDPLDTTAATSSQSLTLLQLLARVDMAGPLLPPDTLARMVVLTATRDDEDDGDDDKSKLSKVSSNNSTETLLQDIRESIRAAIFYRFNESTLPYGELNPWMRSRVPLPQCTLDELQITVQPDQEGNGKRLDFIFQCSVKDMGTVEVIPTEDILQQVCYYYRPKVSATFTSLALALRYQAPIVVLFQENNGNESVNFSSLRQIQARFPLYKTTTQLRQTTDRVQQNIERGFEVNQLQAALRIALEKNDMTAAQKIRAKLDLLDSLADLPVQPESDTDSMQ